MGRGASRTAAWALRLQGVGEMAVGRDGGPEKQTSAGKPFQGAAVTTRPRSTLGATFYKAEGLSEAARPTVMAPQPQRAVDMPLDDSVRPRIPLSNLPSSKVASGACKVLTHTLWCAWRTQPCRAPRSRRRCAHAVGLLATWNQLFSVVRSTIARPSAKWSTYMFRSGWLYRGAMTTAPIGFGAALAVFLLIAVHASGGTNAEAHLNPLGHTASYAFTNSGCTNKVDPISVVFYWDASISAMHQHAHQHGGWVYHDGTFQYFFDHSCFGQDAQDASNPSWSARYHMRYLWNGDPTWGTYTLATPHHEDLLTCGHAVDANSNEPPGGFVMAKWDIGWNWHNWNNGGGSHYFQGSHWWGNNISFTQCDNEQASNDGWVDYVEVNGSHS